MEKDLYLTQAPLSQTPDTTILPQKQRLSIPVKSLTNPNDRRNQVSKKILNNFPLESYYDDKKIKPGISLYKIILEIQDKRKEGQWNLPFLQLNLHPTVAFTDNVNTMIYNEGGIIKTLNYLSYEQYIAKLGITDEDIKNQQEITPLMMTKCCNGIIFENNIIMNNQISAKIIPRSQNVISTKFIIPFASYPNIIRLFFTPRHVKNIKKNIAFKVINRKQMTEQAFKKKHRLANQFMVNIENQETYIATLIKGKALEPCEQMAQSLCEYLEASLMIQISQIVVDFIVDDQKVIYFNDIKSVKSKSKTKLWEIGEPEQIVKIASENNNQIMCRLCGMLYTKNQMKKLVTNKLIYQLASHLQNRGKKLCNIPHMKKEGLSNVCSLCYELIKAEHTLINIERQFSTLMNIRQSTVERVQSKETKQQQLFFYDEEEFQLLGQQTSKYKKWRLFFYVQKLKRIPEMQMNQFQNIQVSLEMKFQNQKERFVKIVRNENYNPASTNLINNSTGDTNLSKNWSKSVRTHNIHVLKRQSTSSRNTTLRVQSAMPHKERYRNQEHAQNMECEQNHQQITLQNQAFQQNQKNKSFFNDQSTNITHSQSYFSSGLNINDRSKYISNQNNMTIQNNLDSLAQDPRQDSYLNMGMPVKMQKNLSQNQNSNFLNNSSVPSSIKIDKVKMFIFYTKAHQNEGKNILNEQQMEFTLSFTGINSALPANPFSKEGPNFKFTGNSSTLKCLKNKQTCQRHSLQIYLFDHGMKYCNLQLTVGMTCDGVYDDQGLDLQKCNNLYWGKTYSCEPLPDQWMEVFTNGQEVPKGNMERVLQTLEQYNFSTSPPKLIEKSNSVNYLKAFQNFANSMNTPQLGNFPSRPLTGMPSSQSTSALKKTSMIRCKTAINRNNLLFSPNTSTMMFDSQQQKTGMNNHQSSSNRNMNSKSNKNSNLLLEQITKEQQDELIVDFDI